MLIRDLEWHWYAKKLHQLFSLKRDEDGSPDAVTPGTGYSICRFNFHLPWLRFLVKSITMHNSYQCTQMPPILLAEDRPISSLRLFRYSILRWPNDICVTKSTRNPPFQTAEVD